MTSEPSVAAMPDYKSKMVSSERLRSVPHLPTPAKGAFFNFDQISCLKPIGWKSDGNQSSSSSSISRGGGGVDMTLVRNLSSGLLRSDQ